MVHFVEGLVVGVDVPSLARWGISPEICEERRDWYREDDTDA